MPTDITKLPLGGPAWLRAMADGKEEMLHALGSFDADGEREEKREILGLRDAADCIERLLAVAKEVSTERMIGWGVRDRARKAICPACYGTRVCGDNGPGVAGNSEWGPCDCTR